MRRIGRSREGNLLILDAEETLSRFMVGGYPDAALFDASVSEVVRTALAESKGAGLRAYGEMVGVLWSNGEYPSAIRLEQLWNKLRSDVPFNLFCGYPIDLFSEQFDANVVNALLCAHTHLLPAGPDGYLEHTVERAMDEVLGHTVRQLRPDCVLPKECADVPRGEALILWVRANLPQQARAILELAHTYYYASNPA